MEMESTCRSRKLKEVAIKRSMTIIQYPLFHLKIPALFFISDDVIL
jgi:hypothetical protein